MWRSPACRENIHKNATGITGATKITGGTEMPRKLTRAAIQEAKEKTKAWHLDRTRDKERKKRG